MSAPFMLNPVDAVDLVHRAIHKARRFEDTPEDVRDAIDTMLSATVFRLRDRFITFPGDCRPAYDLLTEYTR
jgi:hypothetical protein